MWQREGLVELLLWPKTIQTCNGTQRLCFEIFFGNLNWTVYHQNDRLLVKYGNWKNLKSDWLIGQARFGQNAWTEASGDANGCLKLYFEEIRPDYRSSFSDKRAHNSNEGTNVMNTKKCCLTFCSKILVAESSVNTKVCDIY
jgi:hypothetical protein